MGLAVVVAVVMIAGGGCWLEGVCDGVVVVVASRRVCGGCGSW